MKRGPKRELYISSTAEQGYERQRKSQKITLKGKLKQILNHILTLTILVVHASNHFCPPLRVWQQQSGLKDLIDDIWIISN